MNAHFLLALVSVAFCAQVAAQEGATPQQQSAPEQIPAVLKTKEVDFFYRSSVAHFSCSALQGRVASIFRALGARDDVRVGIQNCQTMIGDEPGTMIDVSGSDRDRPSSNRWRTAPSLIGERDRRYEQSSHVRVELMLPTAVTPGVLEELDRDRARRELVSRVTGNTAAIADPIVFPAARQQVKLSRKTVQLEPEDCELIEQMSRSVFPKLGMRMVQRGRSCERDRISHVPLEVVVETLMPVFAEGPKIELAPEEPPATAPAPATTESSDTKSSEPTSPGPPPQ
jgi:hypothetical protein